MKSIWGKAKTRGITLFFQSKTTQLGVFLTFLLLVVILGDYIIYFNYSTLFRYLGSNDDAAVYIYQAKLLSHGVVKYYLAGGLLKFFDYVWFFIRDNGTFYSKYYPGFSLALVPWFKYNLPLWSYLVFLNTLIFLFSFLTLRLFTKEKRILAIGALFLAFCPAMLFLTSNFLSYSIFTFLIVAGGFFFIKFLHDHKIYSLPFASFFFGYALLTRPYEGAVVYLASMMFLFVFLIAKKFSFGKGILGILCFGAPAFVFGLGVLYYDQKVTGNYFQTPFQKFAKDDTIGLGERRVFDNSPYLNYTFAVALQKTQRVFSDFFIPNAFGNALGALAAFLLIFFGFVKKFEAKKLYLLTLILVAFFADFYHWVFSVDFWLTQGGYGYTMFALPPAIILLLASAHKKGTRFRLAYYYILAFIFFSYIFQYNANYHLIKNNTYKRFEIGRKYDQIDKVNSIIFIDSLLLYGDMAFIIPNNTPLESEPLIAEDKGEANKDLMDMFPSKKVYILKNKEFMRIR